jgi:hypothetical protein
MSSARCSTRRPFVAALDVSYHKRSSRPGGGLVALCEGESSWRGAHAFATLDAAPAIEAESAAAVDPDRAGRAESLQRRVGAL